MDDYGDGDDESGTIAFEEAVYQDAPQYLKKFGFDPERDEVEALYENVRSLSMLRTLVAMRPPADWTSITRRFTDRKSKRPLRVPGSGVLSSTPMRPGLWIRD